jgi:hypothetical protein
MDMLTRKVVGVFVRFSCATSTAAQVRVVKKVIAKMP